MKKVWKKTISVITVFLMVFSSTALLSTAAMAEESAPSEFEKNYQTLWELGFVDSEVPSYDDVISRARLAEIAVRLAGTETASGESVGFRDVTAALPEANSINLMTAEQF